MRLIIPAAASRSASNTNSAASKWPAIVGFSRIYLNGGPYRSWLPVPPRCRQGTGPAAEF